MTKLVVTLACVLALTLPLGAQTYVVNLRLVVGASAVGFADAATPTCTSNACLVQGDGHPQADSAVCVSAASGGTFAYRIDGTTATTTEGIEVPPGASFVVTGNLNLLRFSAIRTGATSASLRCVISSN